MHAYLHQAVNQPLGRHHQLHHSLFYYTTHPHLTIQTLTSPPPHHSHTAHLTTAKMKYSAVLVAILASTVAAGVIEQRDDAPKCTVNCIKDNFKESHCGKKDKKCMCTSKDLKKAVVPCIKEKCNKQDLKKAVAWHKKTCGEYTL